MHNDAFPELSGRDNTGFSNVHELSSSRIMVLTEVIVDGQRYFHEPNEIT